MATRPTMETRPPVLIETVVRLLVPPAAREHVLGDLSERYASPRQYVSDAIRTIPFVVASQIRRTTNPALLLIPAFLFMMAFGSGPGEDFGWMRGGLPAMAALIGLVLRDAYRLPDVSRPWRRGLVDIAVVIACALAVQVVLAFTQPEWLIAPDGVVRSAIVLTLLYLVRVQNPTSGVYPSRVAHGATLSIGDLRREVQMYEQGTRRAIGIELATAALVVISFTGIALFAAEAPVLFRIGFAIGAAGGLFVATRMWPSWRLRPVPADVEFTDTVEQYRTRLEHNHHSLRTMWLWYGLPLSVGPMAMFGGAALTSAQPVLAVGGVVLGFLAVGVFFDRVMFSRAARSLRQRIDALETVKERP